jgi:hypothetical protein
VARSLRLLIAVLIALGTIGTSAAYLTYAFGTQVANCSFATLQNDLQAGGDWYYTAGQCPSPISFASPINVNSNASLTALGKDVTLDGGHTSPDTGMELYFVSPGTTLGLTGPTLSHGYSYNFSGGAIVNQDRLQTITVTDNTPASAGGPLLAATIPRLTVRRVRMPANPVAAVKLLVGASGAHPITNDPCYPAKISAFYRQARGCPVTLRLQRLLRTYLPGGTHAGYGSPIIRFGGSNGNPFPFGFHLDHVSSGKAQVTVTPHFYHAPERITFLLVRVSIDWLVDNTYCAGRPATGIYQPVLSSCFTTSGRTDRAPMRGIASKRSAS